jgi:hypothetical protein
MHNFESIWHFRRCFIRIRTNQPKDGRRQFRKQELASPCQTTPGGHCKFISSSLYYTRCCCCSTCWSWLRFSRLKNKIFSSLYLYWLLDGLYFYKRSLTTSSLIKQISSSLSWRTKWNLHSNFVKPSISTQQKRNKQKQVLPTTKWLFRCLAAAPLPIYCDAPEAMRQLAKPLRKEEKKNLYLLRNSFW